MERRERGENGRWNKEWMKGVEEGRREELEGLD